MSRSDTSPSPLQEDGVWSWEFSALTDPGRVRANNEDAVAFDPALGLAILADGMGGYNGGEVASGMALALLQASFGRWLAHAGPSAHARAVRRALQAGTDEANSAILEAGMANLQLQGMGTTLVLAAFGPQRVVIGHIGDSRCYRLRRGQLELLTRDHSLLQEQLDAGVITPQQAARSPHRNLVTRALGIERSVNLEMHEHGTQPGDLYLLCSDGLSEMVSDAQLSTVLLQNCSLAEKALLLVAMANDNGGRDNISVVLASAGVARTAG
ncbi:MULTISPECIES: Stp1/IreP family PP2C-type Ser/Thr phosphatase [unclassified Variovorax]|uniref:Stp1/IreP family PP2C-type Ser/Thr phosphatase n=1 Tax=unclassified Variovorax TaxID=663243 RepID=UPI002578B7CE|nr:MULTISPECIES: Stp1/IreP family PP2C-type Ser/Thr phosphatase [unclassified Variovorax]MDM0091001.1 Stp1/IreP family PP2C-type Ser/Thr phosphatase [Variovorax sp. J22G40]MDM0148997.1 Stp1/IreP family PP2C-type Ser/Thr phosphatase [Variovorax sp. J2P1-31]